MAKSKRKRVPKSTAITGRFPRQHNSVIAKNEQANSCDSFVEPNAQTQNQTGVSLTPRETETLKLLAEGKSNKEIAGALSLSPKTVDTYRARIMLKLGLHSLADLIHYAIRNDLVKP